MAFTEMRERNNHAYYYRVVSVRKGKSVTKKRVYLGSNLSKGILAGKEKEADAKLISEPELFTTIRRILVKFHVEKAGIFGSYAKGKQRKGSDVDIIIMPPEGLGFGFSAIQAELEKRLSRKVDLVTYNGLSPFLKDEILKSEIRLL